MFRTFIVLQQRHKSQSRGSRWDADDETRKCLAASQPFGVHARRRDNDEKRDLAVGGNSTWNHKSWGNYGITSMSRFVKEQGLGWTGWWE